MQVVLLRTAEPQDIVARVETAALQGSLRLVVDADGTTNDSARLKFVGRTTPLTATEIKNTKPLSECNEECRAIAWLAATAWLSNLYRSCSFFPPSQIQQMADVIPSVKPEVLFPAGLDPETGDVFLSRIVQLADLPVTTLPARTVPPPLQAAAGLVSAHKAQTLSKIGLVALALNMEACKIDVGVLESALADCNADIAACASSVQWLLTESKLTDRKVPAGDPSRWLEAASQFAALQEAACVLARVSRAEMRTATKRALEKPAKGAVMPPFLAEHPQPRRTLAGTLADVAASAKSRITLDLLPVAEAAAGGSRTLVPWPAGTEVNPSVEIPADPIPLDKLCLEKLRAMIPEDSRSVKLTEASALIGVELAGATLILADQQADAFNTAAVAAAKGKQTHSGKINFGRPLQQFVESFLRDLLPAEAGRSFPRDRIAYLEAISHKLLSVGDAPAAGALIEGNQRQRRPKTAKGTTDQTPRQMVVRNILFNHVKSTFELYGAVAIDTPMFELRETLTGKYGEDAKLIYDLAEQGGERLSLRYDLTVPFARYCATHNVEKIRRYHISKVFRRDEPQLTRGRYREFHQCDFDIAGEPGVIADAQVITLLVDILKPLRNAVGEFYVKLSHRELLAAIMAEAGVPDHAFRAICSAIDKLDKLPWSAVRQEILEKGQPAEVTDALWMLLTKLGATENRQEQKAFRPEDIIKKIKTETPRLAARCANVVNRLEELIELLNAAQVENFVVLDLSLARGLDYYTGVIYEAVLCEGSMGSIAAGGRYDGLIGAFSGRPLSAVGVSIGIERVIRIVEENLTNRTIQESLVEVYVCSIGAGLTKNKVAIASQLRNAGIAVEFSFAENAKLSKQMAAATDLRVPVCVIFGEDEVKRGTVKLRRFAYTDEDSKPCEIEIELNDLVNEVRKLLQQGESPLETAKRIVLSCGTATQFCSRTGCKITCEANGGTF